VVGVVEQIGGLKFIEMGARYVKMTAIIYLVPTMRLDKRRPFK
jgi:hypothetical protein